MPDREAMSDREIDQALALADKATQGPFSIAAGGIVTSFHESTWKQPVMSFVGGTDDDWSYFVKAASLLPAALTDLRALRTRLAALKADLEARADAADRRARHSFSEGNSAEANAYREVAADIKAAMEKRE